MTGFSDKTVKKYRQEIVDAGYLKEVGTGQYNTTIYELTCPETLGIKEVKAVPAYALENLKKAPNRVVPESVRNYRDKLSQSSSGSVPEVTSVEDDLSSGECPEVEGPVDEGLVPETGNFSSGSLPYEHKEQHTTTSSKEEVVDEDSLLEIKEEAMSKFSWNAYKEIEHSLNIRNLRTSEKEKIWTLLNSRKFKTSKSTYMDELQDCICEVTGEEKW